jgi:hypothetical protein
VGIGDDLGWVEGKQWVIEGRIGRNGINSDQGTGNTRDARAGKANARGPRTHTDTHTKVCALLCPPSRSSRKLNSSQKRYASRAPKS